MSLIDLEYSPEMETKCLTDNTKLVLDLQNVSPSTKFMTENDDTAWPRIEQTTEGPNPSSMEKECNDPEKNSSIFDHDDKELGPDIFLPNKATPSVIRKSLFVIRNEGKKTISLTYE
jgi:hypothetical protein